MQPKSLVELWAAPDSSRLAPKQVSVRLPVHVMARIRALEDVFPTRTRTDIIGGLLASALDGILDALPVEDGEPFDRDPETGETLYSEAGPRAQYRQLANKYYEELERELGNEAPGRLL